LLGHCGGGPFMVDIAVDREGILDSSVRKESAVKKKRFNQISYEM